MNDIDFVLTYLDGNDLEWQKEKNRYSSDGSSDTNPNRYRNWDNLQYFFRGIEKFAPWARKVHIVTWGHIPPWLNTKHPKINIVKHTDYLPAEWLPTFSSRCIDMNLHRIPDLAEQFVYFNDDMFLTAPVNPDLFFKNGLPCDAAVLSAQAFSLNDSVKMYFAPYVDTGVINKYFRKNTIIKKSFTKWMNLKYGIELLRTFTMLPYPQFVCFRNFHLPYSYLKSTYEEVWKKEPEYLGLASSHKFRELTDPNHFLFTYWQYVTGKFVPRNVNYGKCFQIHNLADATEASKAIRNQKYKAVCVNDAVKTGEDFDRIVKVIYDSLDAILPTASSFERRE